MEKYRIALIEDDEILSKSLKEELEDSDFEVLQAFDGEQGFELIKKEKPDLVLLDIIMPKLDGISLLKQLKDDNDVKDIPVVMLTVFGSYKKIADTIDMGAEAYFIKDQQNMTTVVESVREMLKLKNK
jgi:DNA-binding response OmpR family regulator